MHRTSLYYDLFFFSSRRRHTRCLSDWSSDVCSSDLTSNESCFESSLFQKGCAHGPSPVFAFYSPRLILIRTGRSEERRVGKMINDIEIILRFVKRDVKNIRGGDMVVMPDAPEHGTER